MNAYILDLVCEDCLCKMIPNVNRFDEKPPTVECQNTLCGQKGIKHIAPKFPLLVDKG